MSDEHRALDESKRSEAFKRLMDGPSPKPRQPMTRRQQTAWIVAAIVLSAAGIIFYLEATRPAQSIKDCWTSDCRADFKWRALERRGFHL